MKLILAQLRMPFAVIAFLCGLAVAGIGLVALADPVLARGTMGIGFARLGMNLAGGGDYFTPPHSVNGLRPTSFVQPLPPPTP